MGLKLKKPIYKRVWFWLLVVFVGIPTLSAMLRGGNPPAQTTMKPVSISESSVTASSSSKGNMEQSTQSEESTLIIEESAESLRGEKIGDFEVYVTGLRFVEGYSGEHMVAITYAFTNNSNESAAFMYKISETVFQDGIGLDTSFMKTPDVYSDAQSREIRLGITIDVEKSYILSNESDIEIELDSWISISNRNKVNFIIPYSEITE